MPIRRPQSLRVPPRASDRISSPQSPQRSPRLLPEYAELQRVHRVKQVADRPTDALGPELLAFFNQSVAKRQTKMAKVSDCWCRLVPETLSDHCSLESLIRGTLTVLVDSSAHLYELKQLLLAGLEQQLLLAGRATGLRKITLRPGRWYDGDAANDRRVRFKQ